MSSATGSMAPRGNISGYKTSQISNFTPEMMNLFQMLLGGTQGGLGGGLDFLSKLSSGDEGQFQKLEAPAMRQLQGQLGQIGSRFANAGALGSSAFQQEASGAATDLSERLQSQRMGLQQGAIDRLLGLSQNLLQQKPYENVMSKKTGFMDILGSLLGGIGGGIGGGLTGGAGGGIASLIKSLFGG